MMKTTTVARLIDTIMEIKKACDTHNTGRSVTIHCNPRALPRIAKAHQAWYSEKLSDDNTMYSGVLAGCCVYTDLHDYIGINRVEVICIDATSFKY